MLDNQSISICFKEDIAITGSLALQAAPGSNLADANIKCYIPDASGSQNTFKKARAAR